MADSSTTDTSESSDTHGHETCFLDLSAELRNEVYELALFLTEEDEEATQSATACRINFSDATKPMVPEPGLLRSCKQARADASPMFYSRTILEIPLIHLTTFIKSTEPENLAAIKELRIHDYISQCRTNMVGVCKAVKAIKASILRLDAVKVCASSYWGLRSHQVTYYIRDHDYRTGCQWKSLVELEDYVLQYEHPALLYLMDVIRTDTVGFNGKSAQAIAPKQLEGVIEWVNMTPTQEDELTESLLYVARHYKSLKPFA